MASSSSVGGAPLLLAVAMGDDVVLTSHFMVSARQPKRDKVGRAAGAAAPAGGVPAGDDCDDDDGAIDDGAIGLQHQSQPRGRAVSARVATQLQQLYTAVRQRGASLDVSDDEGAASGADHSDDDDEDDGMDGGVRPQPLPSPASESRPACPPAPTTTATTAPTTSACDAGLSQQQPQPQQHSQPLHQQLLQQQQQQQQRQQDLPRGQSDVDLPLAFGPCGDFTCDGLSPVVDAVLAQLMTSGRLDTPLTPFDSPFLGRSLSGISACFGQ